MLKQRISGSSMAFKSIATKISDELNLWASGFPLNMFPQKLCAKVTTNSEASFRWLFFANCCFFSTLLFILLVVSCVKRPFRWELHAVFSWFSYYYYFFSILTIHTYKRAFEFNRKFDWFFNIFTFQCSVFFLNFVFKFFPTKIVTTFDAVNQCFLICIWLIASYFF